MKSFLLVAYAYPPISSPGAVRATRMIKYLGAHGWQASVLTVKDGYSQRIGGLLDPLEGSRDRIHRINDPVAAANARYSDNKSDYQKTNFTSKVKSELKSRLKGFLFPDRSILWARKLKKIKHAQNFSFIYSTSPTASTHLAGYTLSRKYKLPWIAEFRDPLSWLDEKNTASRLRRWGLTKYEAWVVKHAEAVVVVSDTFKEYFENRYPNANIIAIPNGAEFDVDDINDNLKTRKARKMKKSKTLRLVHTGSLYNGARPPANIIAACQKAMKISDLKIECLFAGNDAHLAVEAATVLGCPEIVKDMGVLPHNETTVLLKSADATISLLHREKLGKLSIMSKFLDYLPAGAPILNLGGNDYVLSRIITDQSAGGSFEYDDIDGIANWLVELPNMKAPDTVKLCQNWSADNMALNLANLFEDIHQLTPMR